MNTNPIYIVDDDMDDHAIIKEVIDEMDIENEIKFFTSAEAVLEELHSGTVTPFIIISDTHLPKMDGFELRKRILEQNAITNKCVPFIFWSTTASEQQVKRAFELSAHGFFIKAKTFPDVKKELQEIIQYWTDSLSPRS